MLKINVKDMEQLNKHICPLCKGKGYMDKGIKVDYSDEPKECYKKDYDDDCLVCPFYQKCTKLNQRRGLDTPSEDRLLKLRMIQSKGDEVKG